MKTLQELYGEYNARNGKVLSTDSTVALSNIDDIIFFARKEGVTEILMTDDEMQVIIGFAIAVSKVVPWNQLARGWIDELFGVSFHRVV